MNAQRSLVAASPAASRSLRAVAHRPRGPAGLPRAARRRTAETYSFLWKKPAGGEVEIQIAPVDPGGLPAATADRQPLTPGALVVRGTLALRGRPRGQDDRDRRPRGHDHRRARAPPPRRRAAREPPAAAGDAVGDARRRHDAPPSGRSATCSSASSTSCSASTTCCSCSGLLLIVRRPLDAGEDDHVVHRGPQHHAGDRDARATRARRCRRSTPPSRSASCSSARRSCARWRGETSFTIRHPWVVAFAFGLLHGFGFASGLTAMGLPKAEIPLALLLFNVGRRDRPGRVRAARDPARALVPRAGDALAAAGRAAARLRGGLARARTGRSSGRSCCWAGRDDRIERAARAALDRAAPALLTLARHALARPGLGARRAGRAAGFLAGPAAPGLRPRPRAGDGLRSASGARSSARPRSGCCR